MARRVFLPFPYPDLDRGEWSAYAVERNFEFLANLIDGSTTNSSSTNGGAKVQNLVGTVTLNTSTATLTADSLILRRPSNGSIFAFNNQTLTVDITNFGLNGRDQSGAFTVNSWVHLYAVTDGLNIKTLTSAVSPPTGPTLPSGYIGWAYLTSLRIGAVATQWRYSHDIRGAEVTYRSAQTVLNAGSATVFTAVSFANFIPPIAVSYIVLGYINANSDASGNLSIFLSLSIDGVNLYYDGISGLAVTGTAPVTACAGQVGVALLPNLSQQVYYKIIVSPGSGGSGFLTMNSYRVPNGDS